NFPADTTERYFGLPISLYYDGTLRFHNGISMMKAGILFADKVTTVSDTYSKEILTHDFGENMEAVLESRSWDLSGIVNGIDVELWNPKTDTLLTKNYDARTVKKSKVLNKRALQESLGLRVDDNVMLFGMVSRLTWQKGVYLMIERMFDIMGQDIQLVILGTGETNVENELRQLEYRFPRRAVYYCGYNEELAHQIYAGADMFMMPSLFEPCGISQLISMRYGTLPLVRETGGLKDTVVPYNQYTKEGTGFSFAHFSSEDMLNMMKYAIYVYYMQREDWDRLVQNAMHQDVSWEASCRKYIDLYEQM
ncbi:MAG: glycosyltransferase, partial [Erysipelotrichaceae bacterium]|nr:glycosyltransferase [Erysipelotrichaceae bacterium]